MRKIFVLLILILISFGLMSCKTEADLIAHESNLKVLNVQIIPELDHWLPKIAECAGGISGLAITSQTLPESALDLNSMDLVIRLGNRAESDPFVSVLGTEEFVVIVGDDVPLSSISLDSLMDIYSGKMTHWSDESDSSIQVFSFPEGSTLQKTFNERYLNEMQINSDPTMVFTKETMIASITSNRSAIGYLLKSQVPEDVRILPVSESDNSAQALFVLAVTSQEPEGLMRDLLLCLQEP